jgi:hypothetical protein
MVLSQQKQRGLTSTSRLSMSRDGNQRVLGELPTGQGLRPHGQLLCAPGKIRNVQHSMEGMGSGVADTLRLLVAWGNDVTTTGHDMRTC